MAAVTLFISDLHLTAERPAINDLFLKFLRTEARQADALYILGDLFEYWIGDEAIEFDGNRPLIAALRELADSAVPVRVIPGNRDFLLGRGFEQASHCTLLPDPTCVELYGTPTLLMHGDSLCTQDTEHMAFRRMVHDPEWRRTILAKPVAERETLARTYREISKANMASKHPDIMDVTPEEVESAMRAHGVRHFIHGHTHRPAEHVFTLDGAPAYRTVLGDWYDQGSVLRVTPHGQTLERLPA